MKNINCPLAVIIKDRVYHLYQEKEVFHSHPKSSLTQKPKLSSNACLALSERYSILVLVH